MKKNSFQEVFDFLNKNKIALIMGGAIGMMLSFGLSVLSIGILGVPLHPYNISFSLLVFYSAMSTLNYNDHQKLILLKEAICYWISTFLIIIFLGTYFPSEVFNTDVTEQTQENIFK